MSRILKLILAANLIVLAVLAFVYPHLMVGPGKLIPGHQQLERRSVFEFGGWRRVICRQAGIEVGDLGLVHGAGGAGGVRSNWFDGARFYLTWKLRVWTAPRRSRDELTVGKSYNGWLHRWRPRTDNH